LVAGSFDTAAHMLHDQLAIVHLGPFKPLFLSLHARSRVSLEGLPSAGSLFTFPLHNWEEAAGRAGQPAIGVKVADLATKLQAAYHHTTAGKFSEVFVQLRAILLSVPFLVVATKTELAEAEQLIEICREYLGGLLLENRRKELPKSTPAEQRRNAELCAYFTHYGRQPVHRILTLRSPVNT
ncbi:hypothetical protein PMAYCL1PPCAC_12802, partial [Pristionchus mayeri]